MPVEVSGFRGEVGGSGSGPKIANSRGSEGFSRPGDFGSAKSLLLSRGMGTIVAALWVLDKVHMRTIGKNEVEREPAPYPLRNIPEAHPRRAPQFGGTWNPRISAQMGHE